jgi:hypothetical protein
VNGFSGCGPVLPGLAGVAVVFGYDLFVIVEDSDF